ncbi:hypothetical protein L3K75_13995 [[Ruminococcus] lactaris]|nr:hypothetical protein [[Ruminococcus] lactaris]
MRNDLRFQFIFGKIKADSVLESAFSRFQVMSMFCVSHIFFGVILILRYCYDAAACTALPERVE